MAKPRVLRLGSHRLEVDGLEVRVRDAAGVVRATARLHRQRRGGSVGARTVELVAGVGDPDLLQAAADRLAADAAARSEQQRAASTWGAGAAPTHVIRVPGGMTADMVRRAAEALDALLPELDAQAGRGVRGEAARLLLEVLGEDGLADLAALVRAAGY